MSGFDNETYLTPDANETYMFDDASTAEPSRTDRLLQAKEDKLNRLNNTNQYASLDDSYTDLGDGRVEGNKNKIWNDLTGGQYQSTFNYALDKYTLTPDEQGLLRYKDGSIYDGDTRRLYMFGTRDKTNDVIKFGVSRGDLEGAEGRYIPDIDTGYGWEPGALGVDVEDKRLDVLLPSNVATTLEALAHGRKAALEGRVVRDRYGDPVAADDYGSGASEYYTSREALFGAPEEYNSEVGRELFRQYLADVQDKYYRRGIVDPELARERMQQDAQQYAAENADAIDRAINTVAGFGSTFVSELIVKPLDFVGDQTGAFDLGTSEKLEKGTNDFFGYNPVMAAQAMEEIGKQWDVVADTNASTADRVRAAGRGIIEAFTTPEMLGTSFGALLAWAGPGKFLKAFGVGSKYAKTAAGIDELVATGKLSAAAGKARKLEAFASVDGVKSILTSQAGMITSAMGNVNQQYEEFVKNNKGLALEGRDKAAWFAGRFAVQIVNQNLDKLVDFNVIKHPGVITSIIPAAKAMTNKEFSKLAGTLSKGLVTTSANMGAEAAQEYAQTTMELFNSRFGSETFKDLDTFTKFLQNEDNIKEAGIAALAGAGGAPQFELAGSVLPAAAGLTGAGINAASKLKANKQASGATTETVEPTQFDTPVTETEVSEEERAANTSSANTFADSVLGKYSAMVDDDEFAQIYATDTLEEEAALDLPSFKNKLKGSAKEYRSTIEEIERAEATIEARRGSDKAQDTDDIGLKVLRKTKRELYKNLMEDDSHPTLGSGYDPESIVEDFLETVDVKDGQLQLSAEEEALVQKYAADNEIPPLRFENLRKFREGQKDAAEVLEESVGSGGRSASTYRNKLRTLVNTPNPDRKAVGKLLDDIDYFLNTQENRKEATAAALKTATDNVNGYNAQIRMGKNVPASVKKQHKAGVDVIGYDNFIAVSEDPKTELLRVNPNSVALVDSIQDTITHLTNTKARYGAKARTLLGDSYSSINPNSITVRPNSAMQEQRDRDQKFYDKNKVTKAIVDEKAAKQWGKKGDYYNDNASLINTGNYAEDDVIVIHSTAKKFIKGSPLAKQISAAYKAGATIVVDPELGAAEGLRRFLKQYHFAEVKEGKGNIRYLPKDKATPFIEKAKEAKEAIKAKKKVERDLLLALDFKAQLGDKTLGQALKEGLITKEDTDQYHATLQEADKQFSSRDKMQTFYNNTVKREAEELQNELTSVALSKGFNSPELNDAIIEATNAVEENKLLKASVDKALEDFNNTIDELTKGEQLLSEWNEKSKEAKKGKLDFNVWVKENIAQPMHVVKDMLDTAVGKGKPVVYSYYKNAKEGFTPPTTNLKKIPENTPYQAIELDPNNYVTVDKVTPLNSLNPEQLRIAGSDNIALNRLIAMSKVLLEDTLKSPDLTYGNTKNSILDITNSPAASLIYNKDLKVNENVAIAAHIALYNFIKNSGYLLKKGKKSKKDISEILGIDESQISRDAVKMMSDKGLLYKTAANSIGKDIAGMLGLTRKSDSSSDVQAYDALIADLGQTSLLMGISEGLLERDNSLTSYEFAKTVLDKGTRIADEGNNSKVLFIQLQKGQEEAVSDISEQAKTISESIPDTDVGRKEPNFKPISDKKVKKVVSKIHKERLGLKIASGSQKALKELMDTEWSADLTLMKDILVNQELVKQRLGYIEISPTNPDYVQLSFEEKEVQEAINRGIDKSIEEMQWLVDSNTGNNVSMWFDYFFSKNGRFFIDSNTINPQTDKHLHRFTVQPRSHTNTFTREKGNKFSIGGKDITNNLHYALAQAFGFATDKKDTAKIKQFAETVLKDLDSVEKVQTAKTAFLKTGVFELSDGQKIEMEHLGHALQGFKFLEDSFSGKPFKSAITAEFDAVTSGFGLKNLQMPIISDIYGWLQKVGVVRDGDENLKTTKSKSMNDLLDSGAVKDSYQTLASDVRSISFEDMFEEAGESKGNVITETAYSKELWEALSGFLPKAAEDGVISGDLRSLFKYPFMTFNYSASIKSIRKNLLTAELLVSTAKSMAKADLKDTDSDIVKLMQAFVGKKGDVKALQEKIRTQPLYKIKTSDTSKVSMEQLLGQMIEASYGAQVEKILTDKFGPFVEAQDKVNAAFKAMFEMFFVAFEAELEAARKKGAISKEKEEEIYNNLKSKWPVIKGPLSNMEEDFQAGDGIGIYDTQTSSPFGIHAGRKPSRANLSPRLAEELGSGSVRVSQMIKHMSAAIAAGSVVPIHYVDGAVMAETINSLAYGGIKGITSIHDAIMPSLLHMGKAQQAYNKQTLYTNSKYSFINEIMLTLDRFADEMPATDPRYRKHKVTNKDGETMSIIEFLQVTRNDFAELVNDVNAARVALYTELNKGASIMHMAGTEDGVYKVKPDSIEFKPIEKYDRKEYNLAKSVKVKDQTIQDVRDALAAGPCK